MKRKMLSILLSLVMLATMMPAMAVTVYADIGTGVADAASSIKDSVSNAIGSVLTASEDSGEVELLDDTETELDALGFDTTELPEDYDPDEDGNPMGTEYSTMQEYGEILTYNGKGESPVSKLYGHKNDLNDDYTPFTSEEGLDKSGISTDASASVLAAAGDFKGTGRRSCVAYLTHTRSGALYKDRKFELKIYDPERGESSEAIEVDELEIVKDAYLDKSIMDIDTGDYDGDGLDEIAVIIPQSRDTHLYLAIYKNTDENDVLNKNRWKRVWTHTLDHKINNLSDYTFDYNCVDVVSGDVSGDGIDDMILTWGITDYDGYGKLKTSHSVKSKSQILYGGKTGDMLKKYQDIKFDVDLCRVAFTIGDLNNDGINDVVMGGERIDDAVNGNTSRYLGYYEYDEESGELSPSCLQNINVVDNDEEAYLSSHYMKANIAFCEMYGKSESNCIYLDSVLYKYDDEFEIVSKLYATNGDKSAGPFNGESSSYLEFNATGAYLAGPATQGLMVERAHINDTRKVTDYSMDLVHANPNDLYSGSTLQKETLNSYTPSSALSDIPSQTFATVVDTDNDSAVMRYTGNQTFTYSDPQVYAVLASAPYFKDVAENAEDGGDIKAFSSTSWGNSHGDNQGDGVEFHIQAGGVSDNSFQSPTFSSAMHTEGGFYYSNSVNWVRGKDYTMTYSTSAGEDCVVFFSIPTAVYEYEVEYLAEDDDGNVEQKKKMEYIAIPYTPVSQTITMETYNEIQKQNPSLPVLDGTAITSKCGDPGSYPSSEAGFNDAEVYDGDWSSPSYSNGGTVTQEITSYKERTMSHAIGIYLGGSAEVGEGGGLVGGAFSGNIGYIFSFTNKEGTTASGTVYNMVPDAKGYGYYFSWKLMTYIYKAPDGTEIPVVTYLTKDVTEPPALPEDFKQDHANTTDSQIGLQWTYKGNNVTQFDIYRHTEFPDGANDVLIGTVSQGDFKYKKNKYGDLVYDENGDPIKQYSFIDTGLAEYSDYSYRLQVKRQNVPPWSIPTKELKCKTRALYHPEVQLSEDELTVYYDSINTVTASIKESDSFIVRNKTFQWQKYNDLTAEWEDIPLAQSNSYKFSKNQRQNAGDYRCRINSEISVLGAPYRISAYSETLTVKFAKRNVKFGEITCLEGNDTVRFTLPITNCGDGARTQPQGYINFALDDGQELSTQRVKIDSETQTATVVYKGLRDGTYELSTSYSGNSKTFKDANNPDTFLYMKKVKQAEWLSMKRTNKYNEKLMDTLKLYELYYNGEFSASRKDITNTIKTIKIVDDKGTTSTTDDVLYAEYDSAKIAAGARIPARLENTFNRKELVVKVYDDKGKELASNVRHKLRIQKGSAILGFGDIEVTEKSSKTITGNDLLIWNADSYEDGEKAIRTDKITDGREAFTSPNVFSVAVYTPSGSLLKKDLQINTSNLMPGEYKIKPVAVKTSGQLNEDDLFDIEYKEYSLTVYGNTYTITASGQTINSKTVGSVSLTSPDQIDNVAKLQSGVEYQGGTTVTFKAHPIIGYSLSYWLVNGKKIETPTDILTYAVKGVETNIDVKAVFTLNENRLKVRTLGVGTDSGCSVSCISGDLGGDPVHDEQGTIVMTGKEMTFTATAGAGYEFVEWRYVEANGKTAINKGVDAPSGNTAAFVMGDISATLYAVFQKKRADVELSDHLKAYYLNKTEFNASIEEGVEVEVGKDMKVPVGATMIIRPEGGYIRNGAWNVSVTNTSGESPSVERTAVEGGKAIKFTLPDTATKVSVAADCTLGIYDIVKIPNNSVNINLSINGQAITNDELNAGYSADGGAEFELTATPTRGHKFSYWKINGQKIDNPSRTYAGIVKENMVIDAVCEEVDRHSVNVAVEGQAGTITYVIETPYGVRTTASPLSSDKKIEPVYEGESITFNSVPAAGYIAAYYIIDGEKHECTDNSFTVSNVSKDTNITIGYYPAVYHRLTVENNSKYSVTTSEGRNVEDVLHLGYQESCDLIISGVTDATNHLSVYLDNTELTPVQVGNNYKVIVGPLTADAKLRIEDNNTYLIKDVVELKAFLKKVEDANSQEKINGILTDDIEVTTEADIRYIFNHSSDRPLAGTFDGGGYKIYTSVATSVMTDKDIRLSIFSDISKSGVVKNLTIQGFNFDCKTYYEIDIDNKHDALICKWNHGTIENCTVSNCNIQFSAGRGIRFAWLTKRNDGMIKNCLVKDVNCGYTGSIDFYYCSSIAYQSTSLGTIQSCYVVNSKLQNTPIRNFIISRDGNDVENCWYDQGDIGDASDTGLSGNNVWKNGTKRSAAEIVLLLNNGSQDGAWGTWVGTAASPAYPVPIASGLEKDKNPKVPYKITYKNGEKRVVTYSFEEEITLGNSEDSTVKAWKTADACYTNGSKISINGDTTFEAVADPETEYGCLLRPDENQTKLEYRQYFKDLNEAIAEANKIFEEKDGVVSVYITADKNISESINIGRYIYVWVGQTDGDPTEYKPIVTIGEGCAVENNGNIIIECGATLENYGSFQNNTQGRLVVKTGGSFKNAGVYVNNGKLDPVDFKPTCITHSWGAPQVTIEPTVETEGLKTTTCEVCGREKTAVIDRIPENVTLKFLYGDEIIVGKEQTCTVIAVPTPTDCIGEVTWTSSDTSIATVAPASDAGTHKLKAVVTGGNKVGETTITATYTNDYGYTYSASIVCHVQNATPAAENITTGKQYNDLATALKEADESGADQTVKLLKNLAGLNDEYSIEVAPHVTLDLNGFKLSAKRAMVWGLIQDSGSSGKGKLFVKNKECLVYNSRTMMPSVDNNVLPVWDTADGTNGYIFCPVSALNQKWDPHLASGVNPKYKFQPLSDEIEKVLAADSGIRVFVEIEYKRSGNNYYDKMTIEFGQQNISEYLANYYNNWCMFVTLTGTDNITEIRARTCLKADTCNFSIVNEQLITSAINE